MSMIHLEIIFVFDEESIGFPPHLCCIKIFLVKLLA